MADTLPPCPECASVYAYEMDALLVCPECGHEWSALEAAENQDVIRDSIGNVLGDGDTVTVIKSLKLQGGSGSVKAGTKVRNIRLVAGGHDIDCKIPGLGQIGLKSQYVKKIAPSDS